MRPGPIDIGSKGRQRRRVMAGAGIEALFDERGYVRSPVVDAGLGRGAQLHELRALPLLPPQFQRAPLDAEKGGGLRARKKVVRMCHLATPRLSDAARGGRR